MPALARLRKGIQSIARTAEDCDPPGGAVPWCPAIDFISSTFNAVINAPIQLYIYIYIITQVNQGEVSIKFFGMSYIHSFRGREKKIPC